MTEISRWRASCTIAAPMRPLTALILLATPALAVASGCSSEQDDEGAATAGAGGGWTTQPAVSGARLQARFVAGGGARELVGFHDAHRNEDCTFQRAGDGRMRCLPTAIVTAATGIFSDPACQIPLGVLQGCGADVKYAQTYRTNGGGGCEASTELRKVLEHVSSSYAKGASGCAPQALQSLPAPAALVALGDVVPWTEFVEAGETIAPGDPVAETVLATADGARQHLGFRIDGLAVDCTFQIMPDGITRCVPDGSTGPVVYTDPECTKAAFVNDYGASGSPCTKANRDFWLEPELASGACGVRAVYSLRDSSAPTVDYSSDAYARTDRGRGSLECSSSGFYGSSGSRRAIAADLTASLPTSARIKSGSARLVPALVSSGGAAALALGWHDNERDVDCSFTVASDGKLRCLPAAPSATIFFTDTECKSPSKVAVLGLSCAGPSRFARVASATCPTITRVYALGTETRNLTSGSLETEPGRCPTFAGVNNAVDATEVDPAGFVEGVAVTE